MEPVPTVESLGDRVHAEIRRAIIEGQLAPGSLHSIYKLADQLQVSRTPVREALVKLAEQGMVSFERNRGVRILSTSVHDLEEILSLRLLLEIPATRRMVATITPEVVEELEQALARMSETAEAGEVNEMWVHDRAFHRIIMEGSGNRRLAGFVDDLRDLIVARGVTTAGRSRSLEDIVAEHRALFEAIRDGDSVAAAQLMLDHLMNTSRLLLSQEANVEPAEMMLSWARYVVLDEV